jgi:hypothetical protein
MHKNYIMDDDEKQFDDWWKTYKPIENPFYEDYIAFETFGEELEFVRNQKSECIWTIIEGDSDDLYIVNGIHIVNRFGYYITEVPWQEKDGEFCVPYVTYELDLGEEEDD